MGDAYKLQSYKPSQHAERQRHRWFSGRMLACQFHWSSARAARVRFPADAAFLLERESQAFKQSGMWAMTSPRLALHNGLVQDLLSIKEVPDNLLPDMTRWLIEESLGCMTTWSQDRSSPGHPPFGKREDSCKPPQGERLYPCAWFQVQDPSEARFDLAHVSLVSADDILRIRRVSTLVSPTVELSTPRKPT